MNPIEDTFPVAPRRFHEWLIPLALAFLALTGIAAIWSWHTGAWMDTIHYVEAAEGLARGGLPWISSPFFVTRFLFDSGGRTLTEWPLLFPAAIAALIRAGFDGVTAARLLSAVFYAGLPFALWPLARRFLSVRQSFAVALLTLCAGGNFQHATAGMSESLSIFLSIAGVACVAWFGESLEETPSRAAAYGAWILLAAAGNTRFGGAFVLPGVCAWLFWRAHLAGKIRWMAVWTAGMGLLALFPFLFKRYAAVYSVFDRGPLSDLKTNVIHAARHGVEDMLFGGWAIPLWLVGLVLAVLAGLALKKILRTPLNAFLRWLPSTEALCAAVAGSYLVLIIWTASHRTIDPVNTRYMMPLYPFAFLLAAGLARNVRGMTVVAALSVGLGLLSIRHFVSHALIADDFIAPPQTLAWLQENVSPTDTIITTDWHFARWLGRPVYDMPTWNWAGYTFSAADAALSAHAGRKVFVVVRRRDLEDAVRGKHGEFGAYMKGLVTTGEAPFAQTVASLPDDMVYSFFAPPLSRRKAD